MGPRSPKWLGENGAAVDNRNICSLVQTSYRVRNARGGSYFLGNFIGRVVVVLSFIYLFSYGCSALLHLILESPFLESMGITAITWTQLEKYQRFLLRCASQIFKVPHTKFNVGTFDHIATPAPSGVVFMAQKPHEGVEPTFDRK